EYVPVALEFLVRKGLVIEFVSRLSDVEVCEILKRVLPTFGVTRITRTKAADLSSLVMTPEPACFGAAGKSDMPWRDVVPESDTPRLQPVQQLFVGIVLMVHRAPSRVRTVSFAREVEQWIDYIVEIRDVRRSSSARRRVILMFPRHLNITRRSAKIRFTQIQ